MLYVMNNIVRHIILELKLKGADVEDYGDDVYSIPECGYAYYMRDGKVVREIEFCDAEIRGMVDAFILLLTERYTARSIKIFVSSDSIHVRQNGRYVELAIFEGNETLLVYIDPAIDRVKQYAGKYYEGVKELGSRGVEYGKRGVEWAKEHPEVIVTAGKTAVKYAPALLL